MNKLYSCVLCAKKIFSLLCLDTNAALLYLQLTIATVFRILINLFRTGIHQKFFKASLKFILISAGAFLFNLSNAQTVVLNPASPFTIPAGVTSIKVEVWGGGGGGGGANGSFWYFRLVAAVAAALIIWQHLP